MNPTDPITITLSILGIASAIGALIYHFKTLKDFKVEMTGSLKEAKALIYNIKDTCDVLHQMHDVKDQDGTPLWYVPRSMGATQQAIVDTQKDIAMTLEIVAKTLERIESNQQK